MHYDARGGGVVAPTTKLERTRQRGFPNDLGLSAARAACKEQISIEGLGLRVLDLDALDSLSDAANFPEREVIAGAGA
jgi:hypothetical protein